MLSTTHIRKLVLATAIGAGLAPALAFAAPAASVAPDAEMNRDGFMSVIDEISATAGPYHPVIGKVDYGTEVNAFGNDRGDHIHEGHDVFAPAGTPLVAVDDATVLEAGTDGGRGNFAILYSPELEQTFVYMHMLEPASVNAGEKVKAGERIGELGCTGSCFGDHLHFEIHKGKDGYENGIDPLPLLKKWEQAPK